MDFMRKVIDRSLLWVSASTPVLCSAPGVGGGLLR